MSRSPLSLAFVAARSVVVASAFVALWTWLAAAVRRYDASLGFTIPASARTPGLVLAIAGALLAASCIAAFAVRGGGTAAPFDPPREFVASGPYRYVRNPMYLGAIGVLLGAGLALASPAIVVLAGVFFLLAHAFVLSFEEPALQRRFGDSYRRYRSSVHRWLVAPPRGNAG